MYAVARQVAEEGANVASQPKFIQLNREQSYGGEIDLESLIEADHPARAIWALTGRLDLGSCEEGIGSREGRGGAPRHARHAPRLLVSVWVYAYSQGIASARALERMLSHGPGLRWLCADNPINYHTLSEFRSSEKEKLKHLFAKVLAVMDEEGLIDLRRLMQDGTKVRAVASQWSFHREGTLRNKCAQARALVEEMEKPSEKESGENEEKRRTAARRRAAQA
jgi:transposase